MDGMAAGAAAGQSADFPGNILGGLTLEPAAEKQVDYQYPHRRRRRRANRAAGEDRRSKDMKAKMYNVQFGEAILLQEDAPKSPECLLVDFGSDKPGGGGTSPALLQKVADRIVADTQGKILSVLLSHFHMDHINGILETDLTDRVCLGNVYIPDITEMQFSNGGLSFLQVHLLHELFESVLLYGPPLHRFSLYDLLMKLMSIRGRVHFLSARKTFEVAGRKYMVLWPSFASVTVSKKLSKDLEALLKGKKHDEKDGWFGEEEDGRGLLDRLDRYSEALVKAYRLLLVENSQGTEETLRQLLDLQEAVVAAADRWMEEASQEDKAELKKRMQTMKNQGNRISVVFCDMNSTGKRNILMTGDATAADLKKILGGSCTYTAIKAPHHGTKTHYWSGLPPMRKSPHQQRGAVGCP